MTLKLNGTNSEAAPAYAGDDADTGLQCGTNELKLVTGGTARATVDSSGNFGIGTSAPSELLHIAGATNPAITLQDTTNNTDARIKTNNSGDLVFEADYNNEQSDSRIGFELDGSEKVRIDSSGQLQIGTTSGTGELNVASGGDAAIDIICDSDNNGSNNWPILNFRRNSATGTPAARIYQQEANNALIFDNNGSERMRITSVGDVTTTGNSTFNRATAGFTARSGDSVSITRNGGTPLEMNRGTNDGNLINFFQAGSLEGVVSVSGSTVTYGGGHLARWSQLAGGAERTEILRGSVLSNLDEMCEWGEEDNEQLNRMKVSDVEGDVNVSGVFQSWDDDDDTYTNDFYCAMTGDFVIRIAQGTTVARGDLLMSAGDGTAKPQDDDIVRSKTIAKVTSTTVSTTYSDGSYCVPCVLMAC
jgi:hypothetical protein